MHFFLSNFCCNLVTSSLATYIDEPKGEKLEYFLHFENGHIINYISLASQDIYYLVISVMPGMHLQSFLKFILMKVHKIVDKFVTLYFSYIFRKNIQDKSSLEGFLSVLFSKKLCYVKK